MLKKYRITWLILVANLIWINSVDALQCHQCIYTKPHDEAAKEVLSFIQNLADPIGYQVPEWKEECYRSPSDDLGNFSMTTKTMLTTTPEEVQSPIFEKAWLILSELVRSSRRQWPCEEGGGEGEGDETNGQEEIHGPIKLNETLEPTRNVATQVPVCFELNVRAKTVDPDVRIVYIFRDGAIANLKNYVMNRCYSGIDAVADVVGEQYVKPIREYVMDVEACVCNDKDGCNAKNFGGDAGGGSTGDMMRAIYFPLLTPVALQIFFHN